VADTRIDPLLRKPEPRLRAWTDIALLAQAGMEMTWVSAWYAAIFERQVRLPWWGVWLVLLGVVMGTYAAARLMHAWHVRLRVRQALFLLWIILSALGTLKLVIYLDVRTDLAYLLMAPVRSLLGSDATLLPFLHILFIPLLILRGVFLAEALPEVRSALMNFQLGLTALLLHGLLFLPSHPGFSAGGLFLYLFLGLVTMSTARISGVSSFRGGRLARLNVPWVAGILAGALAVVAAGLLLGRLAVGVPGQVVARVILALFALLGMGIILVLYPVLSLIANLITLVLQQLAERFNSDLFEGLKKSLANLQALTGQLIDRIYPTLHLVRVVVPLLVLLAVIAAVLLWLRLRELDLQMRAEEDAGGLPVGSLAGLLRRLVRQRKTGGRSFEPGRMLAAARIRRVYAGLMGLCAQMGAARKTSQTPDEYLPRAQGLFPGREADLELITRAYDQVRYGEYPESHQEVEDVLAAWKRIQRQKRGGPA
jgi:hypothetical protein